MRDLNCDFYKKIYQDINNLSNNQVKEHWAFHGSFEGRISKPNKLNFVTNICIFIHLYNEELLEEFNDYIKNVESIFNNVNVIFTLKDDTLIDKKIDNKYYVLKIENKGVDINGFIKSYEFINKNKIPCDYILKLHTKTSINKVEGLLNWRKQLIEPVNF